MLKLILITHILCSCLLIIVILMNKGKGAEIGATFNTSENNLFGSKGSSSILNKIIVSMVLLSLLTNISINLINTDLKEKKNYPTIDVYKYQEDLNNTNKKI